MTDDPGRVPAAPDLAAIREIASLVRRGRFRLDPVIIAATLEDLADALEAAQDEAEGWHGAYERRCADYVALQDELIKALGAAAALRAAAPGREVDDLVNAAKAWRHGWPVLAGASTVSLSAALVEAVDAYLAARKAPR